MKTNEDMKLSYTQQLSNMSVLMERQSKQIEEQSKRIEELEARVKQNSQNSSRPPSSDMYKPKAAFERKKGGKIGGQIGHKGETLKMSSTPDQTVAHTTDICVQCGKIHGSEVLVLHSKRQVYDIPKPKIEVTEHQILRWKCEGCKHENQGAYPTDVSAPVQYGKRLMALTIMLNNTCNTARNKIQLLYKSIYGIDINEATLQRHIALGYEALADEESYIKGQLLQGKVLHVDETGLYVGKDRWWLHTASNSLFTNLFVDKTRGGAAHKENKLSILPQYTGVIIHDCWKMYFNFTNSKDGLCGAHILRELTALIERGSKWAKDFHALLLDLYNRSEKGNGVIPIEDRDSIRVQYGEILKKADAEEPLAFKGLTGRAKQTKGRNLYDRLRKHSEAVLLFAFTKEIPFTNNQGERDIRPAKSKMKVSGCFRTELGAHMYARIQSFSSTVIKHAKSPFTEFLAALCGHTPEYRKVDSS